MRPTASLCRVIMFPGWHCSDWRPSWDVPTGSRLGKDAASGRDLCSRIPWDQVLADVLAAKED